MNDLQRLKEMGISVWQLRRDDIFVSPAPEPILLPTSCKLLLVAPSCPKEDSAYFFGKILTSMGLTSKNAMYLAPHAIAYIHEHALSWCWFAGVKLKEPPSLLTTKVNLLHTSSLKELEQDNLAKKKLWHQIKSVINPSS